MGFITEAESVYFAVGIGSSKTIQVTVTLKRVN